MATPQDQSEPLMRQDIYNMMDGLTADWRQNAAHHDALALMTAIAMNSLEEPHIEPYMVNGEGIQERYLVELLGMVPNGIRGTNVIRAAKIRFTRAYRRLPAEIVHHFGEQVFYPAYGHGDYRLHRMIGPFAQFVVEWATQSENFLAWYRGYYEEE